MPYIGRSNDKISNVEILTNLVFDGSSSYSITKNSVPFTPNSAQSLLISIDGVVQATNFTVNGSTIDFGVAIPSTSVCNFFLHYGTGVMTVPSDGSVTTAKLGDGSVTSAKLDSGVALGKVLQVVSFQLNTQSVTSSDFGSTGNATGLKASITPSSTSSKIFVTASVSASTIGDGSNTNKIALLGLKHNTSGTLLIRNRIGADLSATNKDFFGSVILNHLHSPSSTSSQEYEVTFGRWNSTFNNTVEINDGGTQQSNITLMEISA